MKSRSKLAVTFVLLGFVIASIVYVIVRENSVPPAATASTTATPASKQRTIAYYFHGNARCTSCYKIENYSAETIRTKFANELESGLLEWKIINVEQPENSHFISEYQLVTKSVVLVQFDGERQLRWKNLDQVWNHLGDKDQFSEYVQKEVSHFLKGT